MTPEIKYNLSDYETFDFVLGSMNIYDSWVSTTILKNYQKFSKFPGLFLTKFKKWLWKCFPGSVQNISFANALLLLESHAYGFLEAYGVFAISVTWIFNKIYLKIACRKKTCK